MRRRAVAQRAEHAPEAPAHLVGAVAGDLEGLEHDVRAVVADRPGDDLVSVAGQVVLMAEHRQRIALQRLNPALGHRERVVAEIQPARLRIGLVHREVHDPAEGEAVPLDQVELLADDGARLGRDGLELRRLAAKKERGVADAEAELTAQRLGALGAEVLGERTGRLRRAALLAPEDVAHSRQALLLGEGVHAVAKAPRAAAGRRDGADLGSLLLEDLGEDREARAAEAVAGVLHLDGVAQIRLVGAVFPHRLRIGHLRPVGIDPAAVAELLEDALDHRLDDVEHVLLLDEAHFHVELVEIRRRPVGARILVAKARRNLEVPVEPADHDHLLELLRRLGKRVEPARMQPRRHQEVPRALGTRRGDDRRLVLAKARIPHPAADAGDHVRAQRHAALHRLAPQVEVAVAQPRLLRILLVAEHDQRQFVRLAQHLDGADEHLDLAGADLGVDQLGVALLDLAVDPHAPFAAQRLHDAEDRAVGIAHDLGDAVVVAQIDEQHAAMVAHAVHPSGEADGLAHIGLRQVGAAVAAVSVHCALRSEALAVGAESPGGA